MVFIDNDWHAVGSHRIARAHVSRAHDLGRGVVLPVGLRLVRGRLAVSFWNTGCRCGVRALCRGEQVHAALLPSATETSCWRAGTWRSREGVCGCGCQHLTKRCCPRAFSAGEGSSSLFPRHCVAGQRDHRPGCRSCRARVRLRDGALWRSGPDWLIEGEHCLTLPDTTPAHVLSLRVNLRRRTTWSQRLIRPSAE